jgi:hypothetical protein
MNEDPTTNRINPNPCNFEEIVAQFPTISQNFIEIFENNVAEDSFKVKVSTNDSTEDFLINKFEFTASADTPDVRVSAEEITDGGNEDVRLFMDSSSVAGYSNSGQYALCITDDNVEWVDTTAFGGSGSDDKTVKISAGDSASEYLHASMVNTAVYASANDVNVYASIHPVGGGGGVSNETLRLFLDVNVVPGWNGTGTLVWVMVNGVWNFQTLDDFSDSFFSNLSLTGLSYDTSTETLSAGFHMIRGQATSNSAADDDEFGVDGVVALGFGASPGATATIKKADQKVNIRDNEWVTAAYRASNSTWELVSVERYRAIKGKATTLVEGGSTFSIDDIVALDSGQDPRTDVTSAVETVTVYNTTVPSTWNNDDEVWADWNGKDGRWQARPNISSGAGFLFGEITTQATGSTDGTPTTDGEVTLFDEFGGAVVSVSNYFPDMAPVGRVACIAGGDVLVTWSCNDLPD